MLRACIDRVIVKTKSDRTRSFSILVPKRKIKKMISITAGLFAASTYSYNRHMLDKEQTDRYNHLIDKISKGEIILSNVWVQQRQPFPIFAYFQWLLPYHQSLKILNKDGTVRHVGLGASIVKKSFLDRTSEFVSHQTKKYFGLELYEKSIPIEAWVPYKQKFGHYPSNIDVDKLKEITMTREESLMNGLNPKDNIYSTKFGSLIFGIYGKWVTVTCNYALLEAVRKEELIREKNN